MVPSQDQPREPGSRHSERGVAADLGRWSAALSGRIARAFRKLPNERRLAAFAALGLFVSLFLPWYQSTVVVLTPSGKLPSVSDSATGWGAFSFVEAAILIVSVGVLTLLFQRAEGKAFHVPGGDGGVVTAAGGWACILVVWRIFDKQGASTAGRLVESSGIEWGILVALVAAAFLTWTGLRIRAAHRPEPPLPGETPPPPESPRRGERPDGAPPDLADTRVTPPSEQLTMPLSDEARG